MHRNCRRRLVQVLHNTLYDYSTLETNSNLEIRNKYDVAVIGGGIVGTAIARQIKEQFPNSSVVLLEKEKSLAEHQSSHNSGVIHAGIYYRPGSLKSSLCLEGFKLAYEYCEKKRIPYMKCGKLIVATDDNEAQVLYNIYARGLENKVPDLEWLQNNREIQRIEPNCRGVKAVWSPHTGNVDWGMFTKYLGDDFKSFGGDIRLNYKVSSIEQAQDYDYPIIINANDYNFIRTKYLIKCGGFYSDELTCLTSDEKIPRLFSFRVNYRMLHPFKKDLVRTNVYIVPNLPFLGPHFSPKPDGNVVVGPSAIPAFEKDGYHADKISLSYIANMITDFGFQRMLMKNLPECISQFRKTVSNSNQVRELKKVFPSIEEDDVTSGPSAVQAQIIDTEGNFVDDFVVDYFTGTGINKRIIDCKFIPSPGATSCLALSKMVVNKLPLQHTALLQ